MIPLCRDEGIGVIPWSPLARGLLAGNRAAAASKRTTRAQTDAFADVLYDDRRDFDVVDRRRRGRGASAACRRRRSRSRGCCTSPASRRRSSARRSPAISRTRSRRAESTLTAEEIARLEAPYVPHAVSGIF